MDNEPPGDIPIPPLDEDLSRMPGEIWDGDKQCKTHYGENHWQCPQLRVSVLIFLSVAKLDMQKERKGKEEKYQERSRFVHKNDAHALKITYSWQENLFPMSHFSHFHAD